MGWSLKGGILAAAVTAIAGYQDTGSTRLAPWPPLKTHTNTRLTDVAVSWFLLMPALTGLGSVGF